jgi:hypothetical protein
VASNEIAKLRFEGELSWKRASGCSHPLRIEVVEDATFQAGKPVFL